MEINDGILKTEEKIYLKLRELYRRYGYGCFKMSKFEEYDLYGQNKSFLVSDRVITFTDTNGKLMALKPDVTLSIVKNADLTGGVQRLYYNENVYRVSENVHRYKEIMQAGLECLGDLDFYNICETVCLAAKSLEVISKDSVLVLSHLGVLSSVLDRIPVGIRNVITEKIGEKNAHEIKAVCDTAEVNEKDARMLEIMCRHTGNRKETTAALRNLSDDGKVAAALDELEKVIGICEKNTGIKTEADFSITGDLNYYNGLVMNGFVKGIPTKVLSGGQYDKLMEKMGKKAKGFGFAVYLDLLERFGDEKESEGDVLLIYGEGTSPEKIFESIDKLSKKGKRVVAVSEKSDIKGAAKQKREYLIQLVGE